MSRRLVKTHSKKPDLNTIPENNLYDESESIRKAQRQALINVGVGVFVAATKYGAMGGFSASYFTNRNKNAIITVGLISSALAACCNFYSGKVSDDEQVKHDYQHAHDVVNNTIQRIVNRSANNSSSLYR